MTSRAAGFLEPIRAHPRVFHLEDWIYGGLHERTLVSAQHTLSVPSPLNAALRSRNEVEAARGLLRILKLRYRYDHWFKVWDGVRILSFVAHRVGPTSAILDLGSGPHSNVLRWLELYGYTDLTAVDVVFQRPMRRGAIRYFGDDVHRTRFTPGSFGCAFAQSVIEHGIRLPAFFAEAIRVLRPGGYLLVSTDFWPGKIDTTGLTMYGRGWSIFSAEEIAGIVRGAQKAGFHLVGGPPDLRVDGPIVEVLGKGYTFAFFVLQSPD